MQLLNPKCALSDWTNQMAPKYGGSPGSGELLQQTRTGILVVSQ